MVRHDKNEDNLLELHVPTAKQFFDQPETWEALISQDAQKMYTYTTNILTRKDDLPKAMVPNLIETRWQMLAHSTAQVRKDFKKYSYLLEKEIALKKLPPTEPKQDSTKDSESDSEIESEGSLASDEDEEEEGDLFNMRDDELEEIDQKLKDLDSEDDEQQPPVPQEEDLPKFKKTEVDDQFFSLRRMEAELDEMEQLEMNGQQLESLLDIDDADQHRIDYKYEDFFGKRTDVIEDSGKLKTKRINSDAPDTKIKKKKSVSWQDGDQEDVSLPVSDDDEEFEEPISETPVLFGETKASEDDSGLQKRMKKITSRIHELEEENLAPRSWELQGEVAATNREVDALLQKHIQFDATNKRPPEITEDFTTKLESIIKQRIKDKIWDDPVRTIKRTEGVEVYRMTPIEDRQNVKQSLTEIYEKEFQKKSGETNNEQSQKNVAHEEIDGLMSTLFKHLDALYHYEFAPPTVKPELKIVSNMPALQAEEVGTMASTDEQLLAPEETKKRQKGDLKADTERTQSDKLRARRKKKIRQRVMAMRTLGSSANEPKNGAVTKHEKNKKEKTKIRSSDFMKKLNETVRAEINDKEKKLEKKAAKKLHSASNKFVL